MAIPLPHPLLHRRPPCLGKPGLVRARTPRPHREKGRGEFRPGGLPAGPLAGAPATATSRRQKRLSLAASVEAAAVDLRGIRGSNLAIWRADLIRVNGYNEDFVGWGREDSELAVRLTNSGVRRLDVRGWAVCYHLWHPSASSDQSRCQ